MKKKATNQRIAFVSLANIEPGSYQRATNPKQVDNIIKNFDEAKLGTLTVSSRAGRLFVVDGAHRLSALRFLNYTHALCEILSGLTHEQEADYFRKQCQDKRALRPLDLFKAGKIAGDEVCLKISEIMESNSFKIGFSYNDFYQIGAIHALFSIVEDYGFETLDNTLGIIAKTWAGIAKASSGDVLLGVAEFVHRYGAADFDKRLNNSFSVVWHEYREITRRQQTPSKARVNFCRTLVDHYNKGLGSKNKKRLKWED